MRPEILNPLFAEVEVLKGVGPGIAKALARLGLTRAVDLAYHLPTGTIDRLRVPAAAGTMLGRILILEVTPFDSRSSAGKGPTRIFATDRDGNTITLTFFNNPGWAKKQLPLGELRTVFLKWSKVAMAVTLAAGIFLIVAGPGFVAWWIGPAFREPTGDVLRILMCSSLVFLPARGVALPVLIIGVVVLGAAGSIIRTFQSYD